jgi:hypothetical protein
MILSFFIYRQCGMVYIVAVIVRSHVFIHFIYKKGFISGWGNGSGGRLLVR